WSTPVLMEEGGRTQTLIALPGAVFAVDPQTGKELWHCDGLNPLAYANVLVADNAVVGLGGFGGDAIGLRRCGAGDVTTTPLLWQEKQSPQRIGSGVVLDSRAFMPSDAGIVQCLDPQTGKVLWQERPQVPAGQTSSW